MDIANKKILLTGGAGFLGTFVYQELLRQKVPKKNIFIPRSSKEDLRKEKNCRKAVKGKDIVIHLAGNVGGIGKNMDNPGKLFYDNVIMGVQLIHSAMEEKVKKVIVLGTICAYPKYTPIPFKETDLWMGYPEETNAPYGLAKKILLVQSQAYRQQYGLNSIFLLPVNLYGPGDNFDPSSSHVIPALIKKFSDALTNKKNSVEVWGDGSPTREFLYVEDAAKAVVLATKKYSKKDPVNLGSGFEITLKDLVNLIAKIMGYKGRITWDRSKPNGQPRRHVDTSRAKKEFGFAASTSFEKGLMKTIAWYLKNKSNGKSQ